MNRLEIFRLKTMWGNFAFDYACSMSRGRSRGILSVWDPYSFTKDSIWCDDSFVIVKGKWNNSVVRNEQERYGSSFNSIEADHFNAFIESIDVTNLFADIRITALDRLWSDHNPILLQVEKIDFGPPPFKFYNSWLSRDGFDDFVKSKWNMLDVNPKCHDKFRHLKAKIIQWSSINKTMESNRKVIALEELSSIEKKIDDYSASQADKENRINIIYEIKKLDSLESMDLLQKAHIKWDVEGDENSKFFHRLINQKRRNQMINGLMVDGMWIMDPKLIKDTFLQFYEVKFQAQDDQVVFPNLPYSLTLDNRDWDNLERRVNLDEIKEAIWDCGSSKASGRDGYTFAFVKKFWGTIHIDLHEFVDYFFTFSTMPHGANSSFFTLIPKVNNPTCIMDFPPISRCYTVG
nr:hypothetical protein [Tanacetum cinerariifolium]